MIAFLDGGATQTRLWIWDGKRVVSDSARSVGARNGPVDGHSLALRGMVKALLAAARRKVVLDAVMACGMLTSPSGLIELPHLLAPVSARQLASGIQRCDSAGCGEIHFIPSVRTGNTDIMRGEEASDARGHAPTSAAA